MKVVEKLARAIHNAKWSTSPNPAIKEKALEDIEYITKNYLPSGSGFNAGTTVELDECKPNKIVLKTPYHHMNDNGYYTGWTEHKVIITPAFFSFDIKVTGRDKNGIKEYIGETIHYILDAEFKDRR